MAKLRASRVDIVATTATRYRDYHGKPDDDQPAAIADSTLVRCVRCKRHVTVSLSTKLVHRDDESWACNRCIADHAK